MTLQFETLPEEWLRRREGLGVWEGKGKVAAVGVGISPTSRRWDWDPQTSVGSNAMIAIRRAIEDAGVSPDQIDGLIVVPDTTTGRFDWPPVWPEGRDIPAEMEAADRRRRVLTAMVAGCGREVWCPAGTTTRSAGIRSRSTGAMARKTVGTMWTCWWLSRWVGVSPRETKRSNWAVSSRVISPCSTRPRTDRRISSPRSRNAPSESTRDRASVSGRPSVRLKWRPTPRPGWRSARSTASSVPGMLTIRVVELSWPA